MKMNGDSMHDRTTTIFEVDDRFTWLREPLLARLPDGSLCCAFFTGGGHDGDRRNVIAAIRSDNDGATWSAPEILKQLPDQSAWAPSMIRHGDHAHIFWFSSRDGHRYRKVNHLLSTGADGRTFTENREILTGWNGPRGVDIRHGTVLRDGCVLLPIAWMEPIGDFDPDTWVYLPGLGRRQDNLVPKAFRMSTMICPASETGASLILCNDPPDLASGVKKVE